MDRYLNRIALLVAVLALSMSVFVWFESRREIATLRESQREVLSDVASLRRTPIIDVAGAPALGSEEAIVTLIEFSDYECPYCIRHFEQTAPQLKAEFIDTGKVRYVFRDFPVDQLHPGAIKAHEAAQCGRDQGKYWEMHMKLFSKPGSHTPEALERVATDSGLDLGKYRTCMEERPHLEAIRATASIASELGASGTPAFFIGLRDRATEQVKVLQAVTGAQSIDVFRRAIDAVAKRAQR